MSLTRPCALPGALLLAFVPLAAPAAQNFGLEGPSYAGASDEPSGPKSESKLWFTDNAWWGSLWSVSAQAFMIHRYVVASHSWLDTGTAIDTRAKSSADCLWDGAHLYIASHVFTHGNGKSGNPLLVQRYAYDPRARRFSLESGFPVQVADVSTESLVIDKDSTGRVWAVWKAGLRVWMSHTLDDDRSWSAPRVLPSCTSDASSDDICSLVHFHGDRLGVMWSDQVAGAFWFSLHLDSAADTSWSPRTALLSGALSANDHINMKASTDGRVFVLVRTGTGEVQLMVGSSTGPPAHYAVAAPGDGWAKGILLLDEGARVVHCFATSPIAGGTIFEKASSMDAISFPPGQGTPVIVRADDPTNDGATSTKQNLSGETGLIVLASHDASEHYWFHLDSLGGAHPAPPLADFHPAVVQGYAPLSVQFYDASSGLPTTRTWDFGDGGTSSEKNPLHAYATAGLYTVQLTAANTLGSNVRVRPNLIRVDPAPTTLTLRVLEDAQVRQLSPSTNYGELDSLRVRADPSSDYHSYLKFALPATGRVVTDATLRLWVTDASPDGGRVHPSSSSWNEPFLTWDGAPSLTITPVGALGSVALDTWATLDVSLAVPDSGLCSLGIESSSSNSAFYSSREGAHPAELVLTLAPTGFPVANFDASPLSGPPPLVVQLTDTSRGNPTSWSWDLGDGRTASVRNPSHVYADPGFYSVTLTVQNANGADAATRAQFIHVLPRVGSFPGSVPGPRQGPIVPLLGGRGPHPSARLALALDDALDAVSERLEDRGFELHRELQPDGSIRLRALRDGRTLALLLAPEGDTTRVFAASAR